MTGIGPVQPNSLLELWVNEVLEFTASSLGVGVHSLRGLSNYFGPKGAICGSTSGGKLDKLERRRKAIIILITIMRMTSSTNRIIYSIIMTVPAAASG